jgi:hypothetical protein
MEQKWRRRSHRVSEDFQMLLSVTSSACPRKPVELPPAVATQALHCCLTPDGTVFLRDRTSSQTV